VPAPEAVRVECYAGSRGEETPRRVWLAGRWHDTTVVDRWLSESVERGTRMRCFRIRLERGGEGLLCHDEMLDVWSWRAT
jgi:hypothetical protein